MELHGMETVSSEYSEEDLSHDHVQVGTYCGHSVETTSHELRTSSSLGVIVSDQYDLVLLEADSRDNRCNTSLTDPPHHLGRPGKQCTTGEQENSAQLYDHYHHLLSRILKSLSTEEVNELCYISQEVLSDGVQNKIAFNGTILFKNFEQRMLITADNLDYLRRCLESINRIDLCKLIDEYTITCLNGPSLSHSKPITQSHPQSYPHPQSSYVEPLINPEFCDATQLPISQHYQLLPAPSMNMIQSGLCENIQCTLPTQAEEADEQHKSQARLHATIGYQRSLQTGNLSTQVDVLTLQSRMAPPHNSEHGHNKQLQMELASKDHKISDLMEQINKLKQLLQQKQQLERDNERIIEHCIAQVEEVSTQGEPIVIAERYEMKRRPHGIAMIINNCEFYSNDPAVEALPAREDSEIDEQKLHVMWKYLRYDVQVFRNLTASQLNQRLLKIALEDHKNFDSFVCCILSHGGSGGIYGTDGEPVKISEIAALFEGKNNCSSLVNKPKLFFIQACHRNDVDRENDMFGDVLCNSLPTEADFLFAFSTPLEYKSCLSGSWYISCLCEVFTDNAAQQDLLSMLTMVNKKLSETYITEGYKQCPAPVTLLRKQVWFLDNL